MFAQFVLALHLEEKYVHSNVHIEHFLSFTPEDCICTSKIFFLTRDGRAALALSLICQGAHAAPALSLRVAEVLRVLSLARGPRVCLPCPFLLVTLALRVHSLSLVGAIALRVHFR